MREGEREEADRKEAEREKKRQRRKRKNLPDDRTSKKKVNGWKYGFWQISS